MDTIVIGFSRPKSWFEPFSWLIRLALWTPYSHVYIRFHLDSYNADMVFQASTLEVNLYSQAIFESNEDIIQEFTIPVSSATKIAVIEFAMNTVGLPYNVVGILGLPVVWMANWFGKKIANPFNSSGDFCSQLVGQVLTEFLGDALTLPLNVITPKDIFNYLNSAQNG